MSVASPLPDDTLTRPPEPPWREFARAPLVPVALAATVGLLADRYVGAPLAAGLGAAAVALVGWYFTRTPAPQTAHAWLLVCTASLAAVYHHTHRHSFTDNDIGRFTKDVPVVVRVRGTLDPRYPTGIPNRITITLTDGRML